MCAHKGLIGLDSTAKVAVLRGDGSRVNHLLGLFTHISPVISSAWAQCLRAVGQTGCCVDALHEGAESPNTPIGLAEGCLAALAGPPPHHPGQWCDSALGVCLCWHAE